MTIRIVAPTQLAVDLDLVKKNMVIDGDHMDDVVTGWVQGIIAALEQEIGQCLMAQTWRVTLDAFAPEIALPHPVIGIVSVKYVDPDGVEQVGPDISDDDASIFQQSRDFLVTYVEQN